MMNRDAMRETDIRSKSHPRRGFWPRPAGAVLSLLILVAMLGVAACGGGGASSSGTPAPEPAASQQPAATPPAAEAADPAATTPAAEADSAPGLSPAELEARVARLEAEAEEVRAREAAVTAREADLAKRESRTQRPAPTPAPAAKPAPPEPAAQTRTAEMEPPPEPEQVSAPAPAPRPEPAPVRQVTVSLPVGTSLDVELLDTLSSTASQAGDTFRTRVSANVYDADGRLAIPQGAEVLGVVTEAVPLKRVGGQATLAIRFTDLVQPDGTTNAISASLLEKGKSETGRDAATIGGAAAGGAILGRILDRGDKKRGTVLGAILGAAAGTAIASKTEGEEVVMPQGSVVRLWLDQPLRLNVPERY